MDTFKPEHLFRLKVYCCVEDSQIWLIKRNFGLAWELIIYRIYHQVF